MHKVLKLRDTVDDEETGTAIPCIGSTQSKYIIPSHADVKHSEDDEG